MGNIVIATIIYFIVVYLPFYAFGRYFYPAIPLVAILSAYEVINIIESKRSKGFISKVKYIGSNLIDKMKRRPKLQIK